MSTNQDRQERLVDQEGALQRLGGDRQLFNEFITIYMEDSPTLLEEIRRGLSSNDASAVEKNAHSLKGLMSNFGAKECVEFALKIELAGRAGSVADCDEDFKNLESFHVRLSEELRSIRSAD